MYSRVLISSLEVKYFSIILFFSFTSLFRSNVFTSIKNFYFLLLNALVDHICIIEILLWNNMVFSMKLNINYVIYI